MHPLHTGSSSDSFTLKAKERIDSRVRRVSAFSTVEDVTVAKTWISVSQDSIFGTEQKCDVLYRGIHQLDETNLKPANR